MHYRKCTLTGETMRQHIQWGRIKQSVDSVEEVMPQREEGKIGIKMCWTRMYTRWGNMVNKGKWKRNVKIINGEHMSADYNSGDMNIFSVIIVKVLRL